MAIDAASEIKDAIAQFVVDNFLFGDQGGLPGSADSLMGTGVVDSTGILELIEFLEERFGITVADDETTPANLDSLDRLTAFVVAKTAI